MNEQALQKELHKIIRVNHAGEMGAKVIYSGQVAALKLKRDSETLALVEHMKSQEDLHFEYFDTKLKERKVRPTMIQPIWKVGGFALGFLTALCDKKAAMVCTTAVEETIDAHYFEQIKTLETQELLTSNNESQKEELRQLKEKIVKFRDEEIEHRDIGYKNYAADFKGFKPLSTLIKTITKFAIATSKRI